MIFLKWEISLLRLRSLAVMNEEKLRSLVRQMISEQDEKKDDQTEKSEEPKKRSKKKKNDTKPGEIGATMGRGRWSKEVAEAGALAAEAPDELMQNLGIEKKASGYQGVATILQQAMKADVMARSYGGLQSVDQGGKKGLMVSMGDLDSRNGAKYLHHTLIGAINAGMLSLDVPLQIDRLDTSTVVIYKSPTKNSWSKEAKE